LEIGGDSINRFIKYLIAAAHPAFWPALERGVMPTVEHFAALKSFNASTVIDVGANKGQFSLVARYLFPSACIHAFEPLQKECRIYQSVVSHPIKVRSTALGDATGSATFFVASRADSSSLLPLGNKQQSAYGVKLQYTITVDVETLDSAMSMESLVKPVLLKIDVQGSELSVISGGTKILQFIDAVYCEVSFVELYDGQATASTIISFLDRYGFALRGVFNLSNTKQFGPTQADLLFTRR
jgi:FkbM family methyltransferase